MADALFSWIENTHAGRPWGRVLDAGTGTHSLRWLSGLSSELLVAVTAEDSVADKMCRTFKAALRAQDRVVVGHWSDPGFLAEERYDTVVADYLFGAVDRFEPYAQLDTMDAVVARVAPGGRLYVVGMQPHPRRAPTADGERILDLMRLKDAAFLLARDRTYREYPESWIISRLEARGFRVVGRDAFTILCNERYVETHVRSARNALRGVVDRLPAVARSMGQALEAARIELVEIARRAPIPLGSNYVIALEPAAET